MKPILIEHSIAKIFKVLLPGFCQNKDLVPLIMTWTRRSQAFYTFLVCIFVRVMTSNLKSNTFFFVKIRESLWLIVTLTFTPLGCQCFSGSGGVLTCSLSLCQIYVEKPWGKLQSISRNTRIYRNWWTLFITSCICVCVCVCVSEWEMFQNIVLLLNINELKHSLLDQIWRSIIEHFYVWVSSSLVLEESFKHISNSYRLKHCYPAQSFNIMHNTEKTD